MSWHVESTGSVTLRGSRYLFQVLPGILLGLSLLLLAAPSLGQTAADKATARELAGAGIKDLQRGDAHLAEQKLRKAQALYDAPIHLLYLARAQVQQGKFVEASENYRTLVRTKLGENAPQPFIRAKSDGKSELRELEPRFARLTINVSPSDISELKVTLNDEPVKPAALSTARPADPGKQLIVASAPGFETSRMQFELDEGGQRSVELELVALADGAMAAVPSESSNADEEEAAKSEELASMGFIVGLRGGGYFPMGDLQQGTPMSEYYRHGFGARGELGFRFLKYLSLKGFFSYASLIPGKQLKEVDELRYGQDSTIGATGRASQTSAGVALMVTTDPRKFGAFVEIGVAFLNDYRWAQLVTPGDSAFEPCKDSAHSPGWATRLGGGLLFPVTSFLNVVPDLQFELGQQSRLITDYGCSGFDEAAELLPPAEKFEKKAMHYQVFLGIGVDLHFGDSLFR